MNFRQVIIPSLLLAACATVDVPPPAPAAGSSSGWDAAQFRKSIDEGIDALYKANPVWATKVGLHAYDDQIPDLSATAEAQIAADFTARAEHLRTLAANAPEDASAPEAGTDHPSLDARLLAGLLEADAFDRSTDRAIERDPSLVLRTIAVGITGLTDHDYASKQARMAPLAVRLAHFPALLEVARSRLVRPSHAALENLAVVAKGLSSMLRGPAVQEWCAGLDGEPALKTALTTNAAALATAIDAYVSAVQSTFPLAAAKDEPMGAERWSQLARLNEGVTDTPAVIRAMGEAELSRLQAELDALIAQSPNPHETRAELFNRLEKDTLPADGVLAEYQLAEKRVEAWMHQRPVATVPWEKFALIVVPSPPQMRGISFASMNSAGVFDAVSDARLEVNQPEPDMPAEKRAALLRFNARDAVDLVTLHEGSPGHYLQALFVKAVPSRVRKITRTATFSEGWAHYCEQMALENGYPIHDAFRGKAFYLRMALQRAARVVIDVAENDGSMTLDQAAQYLVDNAMLAPEAAKIEARRAVVMPANMFSYTYGKLSILKLRDAVKAREGANFDLHRFHDRLLSSGYLPIGLVGKVAFGLE